MSKDSERTLLGYLQICGLNQHELKAAQKLLHKHTIEARLDERLAARKEVSRHRPIFLTVDDTNPLLSDDYLAEKAVKIRDQLRKEVLADFDNRTSELKREATK